MKTVVPAFKHLWHDLSFFGKATFVLSVVLMALCAGLMINIAIDDAQNKGHYRGLINTTTETVETICANSPELCKKK